ncbi:hypothetical protein CRG98_044928 [Punica granatum]|uniref:Uncharacterized protein n=1 Tax=Punica granatum TaxID=22663 RepID=A0A2I0HSI3_PUNGR|nr:hypothetical protein CRG98_044928 [Punica granatum]
MAGNNEGSKLSERINTEKASKQYERIITEKAFFAATRHADYATFRTYALTLRITLCTTALANVLTSHLVRSHPGYESTLCVRVTRMSVHSRMHMHRHHAKPSMLESNQKSASWLTPPRPSMEDESGLRSVVRAGV